MSYKICTVFDEDGKEIIEVVTGEVRDKYQTKKLKYYIICGLPNMTFSSYMSAYLYVLYLLNSKKKKPKRSFFIKAKYHSVRYSRM